MNLLHYKDQEGMVRDIMESTTIKLRDQGISDYIIDMHGPDFFPEMPNEPVMRWVETKPNDMTTLQTRMCNLVCMCRAWLSYHEDTEELEKTLEQEMQYIEHDNNEKPEINREELEKYLRFKIEDLYRECYEKAEIIGEENRKKATHAAHAQRSDAKSEGKLFYYSYLKKHGKAPHTREIEKHLISVGIKPPQFRTIGNWPSIWKKDK